MTTPSPAFPRYFKAKGYSTVLRFENSSYGTFTNTERVSEYWVLNDVLKRPDLWTEITSVEAIALLTARNGGGE